MIVGLAIATENAVAVEVNIRELLRPYGYHWSSGIERLDFYTDGGFHVFANQGDFNLFGAILDHPGIDVGQSQGVPPSLSEGIAEQIDALQKHSNDSVFPDLIDQMVNMCHAQGCSRLAVFFANTWEPQTVFRRTRGTADQLLSLLRMDGGWSQLVFDPAVGVLVESDESPLVVDLVF